MTLTKDPRPPFKQLLAFAHELADGAGAAILPHFRRRIAVDNKADDGGYDPVTIADRAAERRIAKAIAQRYPGHGLVGEEYGTVNPGARWRWIVDPIDGTRGFAKKNGEFSVMIGLAVKGEAVLGAVHEPAIGRITYAVRQQGCFVLEKGSHRPKPCFVSRTAGLPRATLSISRSQKAEGVKRLLEGFSAAKAVQTYSAGIKLAQVARGETDLYLGDYLTLKDWDVCAGHILVVEAGGKVTSVDGEPIRYDGSGKSLRGRGILATNGPLHDAALDVLRSGRFVFT